ncbi:putative ribose-5-phosphate isomerase 1 [Primulina tabacum]|uniref:putative ribose-5-phosphate isomerase 1 n=1 Tax=Primulina tabacum TaxID=48773 RepID=UPI003F59DADD
MAVAYPRFLVSETHTAVEPPTLMGSSTVSPASVSLTQDDLKKIAAYKAVEHVKSGMVVGLGTGSTAKHAVDRIADLMRQGKLKDIVGIPTSTKTYDQAISLGIPLSDLDSHPFVDLAIDGADEVDPGLNLVKGRGGSLLREKMVESVSKKFIVIVDESKLVKHVGGSGLAMPVEVIPFCWNHSLRRLVDMFACAGCVGELRMSVENGKPSVTDNGNFVIDLYFERDIGNLNEASDAILRLPGIVEHGMFIGLATSVIVAGVEGITIKTKAGTEVEVDSFSYGDLRNGF